MSELPSTVVLTPEGNELGSAEVQQDRKHVLHAEADAASHDIRLRFATRRALFDFAKSLLHAAVFGKSGSIEFHPLMSDGQPQVVNGVRMSEQSARLLVSYGEGVVPRPFIRRGESPPAS